MLKSQWLRSINRQGDSLRLGTDWTLSDLAKPQVLIESAYGTLHPGQYHLGALAEAAARGVIEAGGKPVQCFASDICDGLAQGHEGMDYSLVSRETIAHITEIHGAAAPFDGLVTLASCDKSIPGHLLAAARLNLPTVVVPGGTMRDGPGHFSADQIWSVNERFARGEGSSKELELLQLQGCPSWGACQFLGTACGMQIAVEALGLALPGTAIMPATLALHRQAAVAAGRQVVKLSTKDIRPRRILTREAFENALVLHAATGGSPNIVLHLIALAAEVGVELGFSDFDRVHRKVPVLVNVKTTGQYPVEYLWYAGGVPGLMEELRPWLYLDALTVTGRTVEQNLQEIAGSPFYQLARAYLQNFAVRVSDVQATRDAPFASQGPLAALFGNLAPQGAIINTGGLPEERLRHTGPAVPFDSEEEAAQAIADGRIMPGDVVVIRYEGPAAAGMPELHHPTAALLTHPALRKTTALVTDGRFAGVSRGLCVGYVTPEAQVGGPLALVRAGDTIVIDVPARRLDMIGEQGKEATRAEGDRILAQRRREWSQRPRRHATGVLDLYTRAVGATSRGAVMDVREEGN
ncbi:MAG: dihydroxy-acid dehydratase [bacterium]|jgi:dihydroxy-acid dehydratase